MNHKIRMFVVAVLILALLTAAILGLAIAPAHPLTWLVIALLVLLPFINSKLAAARLVRWKPEYSVGIESIDAQHRQLIELINRLQNTVDYATGGDYERAALEAVVDYTLTHFRYEEDLMAEHDYPSFEAHRAEHQKMVARVEELVQAYRDNQDRALQDALAYLKAWLINHINGTDQQYSEFLIAKGVR